jgi:SNF2 family DNA or RNA helicase
MQNGFSQSAQKQKWQPHPYQLNALSLMMKQGSVGLFLDPGLGKTSIVLAAFKALKKAGYAKKMLIVAPLRPCYAVWPNEIEKWAEFNDLTYVILHGPQKVEALYLDADIYIINPEGLLWLYNKQLNNPRPTFDILCIDESTKFKNSTTRRFKTLRPLLPDFKRRWILTGTPVPNGILDLFGQIYILDLGRALGKYITHYRSEMFYQPPGRIYDWRPRPGAFENVIQRISPLVYQLTAEDHLKMPKLIYSDISVELPTKAMVTYKDVEDNFITLLQDDMLVADNAAVAGIKCRQIANGAVYVGDEWKEVHDAKLDALEDLVEELGGAPALLLYEFDHDRERISERFSDIPCLGSGLAPKKVEAMVSRFNAGDIPLLLGHPGSMGHGLNLQGACHHVIWFGITWNLEYYEQAIRRVYRQGQQAETVFVYHLIAKDTLDERVVSVLKLKDKTQRTLLDALGSTRRARLKVQQG